MRYKVAYLLPLPVILNSIINFFSDKAYSIIDRSYIIFLISVSIYILIFYFVGKTVSNVLNLSLVTSGFSIFLLSFFIFDHLFLFLTRYVSFQTTYFLVLLFWVVFFLYKKVEWKNLLRIFLLFLILNYFNINFLEDFEIINNPGLSSDLKHFWLPTLENIFSNNYFFVLENNIIQGYGLVINYLQAVVFKIGFFNNFAYNTIPITAFFLFSSLFFWEIKTSKLTKIYTITFFQLFILNSDWLRYLFVESLMSESIIGFIFVVLVYEVINYKNKIIICFFLGTLMLSKQFVILLVMLISIYLLFKTRNLYSFLTTFIVYIVDKLNFIFFVKVPNTNDYYESITFATFLSDAEYGNAIDIIKFLYIDKIFTYVMFSFVVILLIDIFKKSKFTEIKTMFILIFLFNFLLVLVLYSTVWRDATFQSSYRYILNTIYFLFIYISIAIDENINFPNRFIFDKKPNKRL